MCGLRVPTHAAHRIYTDALLVYLWYTRRIPGNVPGRTVGRATAAAAALAADNVSTSNFVGRELLAILHVAIRRRFIPALLRRAKANSTGTFLTGSSVSARALENGR